MALRDTLPLFVMKPISIDVPPSKLVPKASYTKDEEEVKVPLATKSQSDEITLPDAYKSYDPLMTAINDSTITNPQAKLAVLAQMGLERGWKAPEDNNYGNIISGGVWSGATSKRGDKDASGNPITQDFRVYNSAKDFVNDYISVLKKTYPKAYEELMSNNFDIDRFSSGLVDGKFKYATDPQYKTKVKGVYNSVLSTIFKNKQ